jgi:hypothetical protein
MDGRINIDAFTKTINPQKISIKIKYLNRIQKSINPKANPRNTKIKKR